MGVPRRGRVTSLNPASPKADQVLVAPLRTSHSPHLATPLYLIHLLITIPIGILVLFSRNPLIPDSPNFHQLILKIGRPLSKITIRDRPSRSIYLAILQPLRKPLRHAAMDILRVREDGDFRFG